MLGRAHPVTQPAAARRWRVAAALVAAGAAAALAGPATASAATLTVSAETVNGAPLNRLVYDAGPLESNTLIVQQQVNAQGQVVQLFNDAVPIAIKTSPQICTHPTSDATKVTCNASALPGGKYHRANIDLNDGTNRLFFESPFPVLATAAEAAQNEFFGGPGNDALSGSVNGNDRLIGGAGNDMLLGHGGADVLDGGFGTDQLFGGDGPDSLRGSTGADLLVGNAGIDTASYTERTNGVKVTIDDVANDGETGEGDNVKPDIEIVRGGAGSDTIEGGAGRDQLFGGAGGDSLSGRSGDDSLFGQDGPDTLRGGLGADQLLGGNGPDLVDYRDSTQRVTVDLDGQTGDDGAVGEGDTVHPDVENITGSFLSDTLTGNANANSIIGLDGNDVIDGGLGADSLLGGNDSDTLRAKDGIADKFVDCGADRDQVDADNIDNPADCESKATPAVGIGPERARVDDGGRVKLSLHCWATSAERCTGKLTLQRASGKARGIGSRRFTVASGDTTTVRVRLARSARQAVADNKKMPVRAITRARDGAGHKWTSRRTLTLVR